MALRYWNRFLHSTNRDLHATLRRRRWDIAFRQAIFLADKKMVVEHAFDFTMVILVVFSILAIAIGHLIVSALEKRKDVCDNLIFHRRAALDSLGGRQKTFLKSLFGRLYPQSSPPNP
jgi:hypothetical protein